MDQGTHVVGVHMGMVDTDMAAGVEAPKISPTALSNAGLGAIESGLDEVLADGWAKFVKSGLALGPSERYGAAVLGVARGLTSWGGPHLLVLGGPQARTSRRVKSLAPTCVSVTP
ncbi:hypothetical protein EU244_030650 [Rhodococcus qingshengii]|uniref:hypothetical protein n=1 Tax=Rhodococcus qingshengii TaxID=334542 RepID=UPI0010A60C13|nr:hypothetical protein [Rhodococcus qingshengii]THJ65730.1 hypothetical protein EU244_29055 [Rhodococcus qingshengii]